MPQGHYDTMQVCLGGHRITSSLHESPHRGETHCGKCGKRTIHACQKCGQEIRGEYRIPEVNIIGERVYSRSFPRSIPKFCINCGKPFPWTREKIEALEELAAEEESLSDEDRETIRQNAPLIATDDPKSELAALRIKKIMGKIGKTAAPFFTKIVTELATEAAKKLMGL